MGKKDNKGGEMKAGDERTNIGKNSPSLCTSCRVSKERERGGRGDAGSLISYDNRVGKGAREKKITSIQARCCTSSPQTWGGGAVYPDAGLKRDQKKRKGL